MRQYDKRAKDSHMNMLFQNGIDDRLQPNKYGFPTLEYKSNLLCLLLDRTLILFLGHGYLHIQTYTCGRN